MKMRGQDVQRSIQKHIMPITRGWVNYFKIAEVKGVFEELDGWIRRKIRCIIWRQWKTGRTRYERLRALRVKKATCRRTAYSGKGPWRMSRTPGVHRALSNFYIKKMGYISMKQLARLQ